MNYKSIHIYEQIVEPFCDTNFTKKLIGSLIVAVLLFGLANIEVVRGETEQSIIDQSFTSPYGLGASINDCCAYVAQIFTAGITGSLTGVNIDVESQKLSKLHVAIHTVENGLPTWNVLGSTTLNSSGSPLSENITFPQVIPVVAGIKYAIVVSYVNAPPPGQGEAQGVWQGAINDVYKGGEMLAFLGNSWIYEGSGYDVHFQTYVAPTPQRPTILISTDKSSYKPGDRMIVGLNLTNPGATEIVKASVWVDMPGEGKHMVMDNLHLSLPTGFNYSNKVPIILPKMPSGNYAWHAVLKNSKSEIISESIAPWTFTGTGVTVESFETVLNNVVIDIER